MPRPRALLFDLGNVLIDIDFTRTLAHWAGNAGVDADTLRGRFAVDANYKAYEQGALELADYFAHLRGVLGVDLTDAEFLAGWNAIFIGQRAHLTPLLTQAAKTYPLYVFSNTNRAHEEFWSREYAEILAPFTHLFVSSTIGLRKPDRAAFAHVAAAMGHAPADILFLDDLKENIDGAAAVGFQTVHITRAQDVEDAVRALLTA